ncbi:hypothetical protein EUTSA_v10002761mg [Eutrema salsugineum]|uniref:Uncharacterized protein n=1 Tax=Eutrema salsugineum TaxID=72664 RepID=V4KGT2_EUTSA|nr:hypothetical protein EUTSA_v10002761mg [Eutrema salsugineum]
MMPKVEEGESQRLSPDLQEGDMAEQHPNSQKIPCFTIQDQRFFYHEKRSFSPLRISEGFQSLK